MKNTIFKTTAFLGIITLLMFMAPPAKAMTLYDDFSSSLLNADKWIWLEFVREAQGGKFVSMARRTYDMDACINAGGNPNRIESELTLKAVEGLDNGLFRSRIGEWIYNDGTGTGPGDFTGDVWAELGLGLHHGVLEARWLVNKSLNTDHTSWSLLGTGSLGPVSTDVLYHLSLSWDQGSGTVTFSVDGNTNVFTVSDTVNDPSNSSWGIGTKLSFNAPQLAMVKGVFDNVKKDGVLYDDFEGTELEGSKWRQLEFAREIRNGSCYFRDRTFPGKTSNPAIGFPQSEGITRIQTKATLRQLVPNGATASANIYAAFYSDGPDSNILARINIGDRGDGFLNAWCDLIRVYASGTGGVGLDAFSFGPITMNQQYLISVGYDGDRTLEFQLDGATHFLQGPPRNGPPHDFYTGKAIKAGVYAGDSPGAIIVEIDDVMITSDQLKPDIKANGSDGPITVSPIDPVAIDISLDPGEYAGYNADWWVAAHTPFPPPGDWYTYVYPAGWFPGINLCAQAGLFDLSPYQVLNMTLPVGNYTFYFALDPPDGMVTADLLDSVEVKVVASPPPTYTNSLGQTFVLLPAGTFTMGSPSSEPGRYDDESPQHQVTLTQSFYMMTTEVTQTQWETVMGSNPSYFSGCPTCPVDGVSWNDIQVFLGYMNARGEGTYGLPTEAQWEYAARAGSTTAFYNGDITELGCGYDPNLDTIGWYCYNSDYETRPAAWKAPNAWDLYDMSGNVWEWCSDWYGFDYYSNSPTDNPQGPSSGSARVIRGGSWNDGAQYSRSAYRGNITPDIRSGIGFRLVLSLGQQ